MFTEFLETGMVEGHFRLLDLFLNSIVLSQSSHFPVALRSSHCIFHNLFRVRYSPFFSVLTDGSGSE